MKTRISNRQAHGYVDRHQPFIAHNIFAQWTNDGNRYVVYSYGKHWPMFIWDNQTNRWYENASKYSVTTSKHRSQTRPSASVDTTLLHVDDMCKVAYEGVAGIV